MQRLSSARVENLKLRSRILSLVREYFDEKGFLSIETPCRIPSPIPELYIETIQSEEWFLHPSPEICMKRVLADSIPRIYQISRCWRKGERGRLHLPEFTMLEWYRSDSDYTDLMNDCAGLFRYIANALGYNDQIKYRGHHISLTDQWEKLSVNEAFLEYAGISAFEAIESDVFDILMVEKIEPELGFVKPLILYDYPEQRASLARRKKDDPLLAERFELYVAGMEIANGFSELTDPAEQRIRFEHEEELRKEKGLPPYQGVEKFLDDLSRVPDSAGIALGLDRLVMLFCDTEKIDDVVAFTPEEL